MDSIVELQNIPVMRIKADMKGKGPSEAFTILESKLSTLRGRKFYGAVRKLQNGDVEYYACVEITESDDPVRVQLETAVIPGGKYARRKIIGWQKIVSEGRLADVFEEFVHANEHYIDFSEVRPALEFYRSHEELVLLMPAKD